MLTRGVKSRRISRFSKTTSAAAAWRRKPRRSPRGVRSAALPTHPMPIAMHAPSSG